MESVVNHWGGPFGAVIARTGYVVARGQNRVLLTGDPTAHAEMEAIRKAVQILNPYSPTIAPEHHGEATLALGAVQTPPPGVPRRSRMLSGLEIYSTGEPCPMCLAAIYWARLDACYFACDGEMTRKIGFDDGEIYEELGKPLEARHLRMAKVPSKLAQAAYDKWLESPARHAY